MSVGNIDNNEFEAKIKISNFSSKEEILDKINSFCSIKKGEEENSSYDIEKETSNMLLLNFHKKTELANYVNNNLKLLKIESNNFSDLKINLIIKVKNPFLEKQKQAKTDRENNEDNKKEKKKIKINKTDIFNIDTKNNPCLNKLLSKSLNFSKKNINKCTNPENSKLKIYESIFLGGPYLNKVELIKEENRKNKEQWLNKKGFNPYISKNTILKNSYKMGNILFDEPAQDYRFKFRSVQKSKWVGKRDFIPYS